jgi:hypothetical protein
MSQKPTAPYSDPLFQDANIPVPIMIETDLTSLTSTTLSLLQLPEGTIITGMGILISTQTNGASTLSLLDSSNNELMLLTVPTAQTVGTMINSLKDNSTTTVTVGADSPFVVLGPTTTFKLKVKTVAATAGKGYAILYIRPAVK